MLRSIIGILICIAYMITAAECESCELILESYPPLVMRNFGSRKIISQLMDNIQLDEGESIKAYCESGFDTNFQNQVTYEEDTLPNSKSFEFRCAFRSQSTGRTSIEYKTKSNRNFVDSLNRQLRISCNGGVKQFLYESKRKLPNCENYISYGIGNAATNMKPLIKTAICYDLDQLQLKYVNYLAQRLKYDFLFTNNQTDTKFEAVDLDLKINNFDSYFKFMSPRTFNITRDQMKSQHELLQLHDFDYMSLIQESTLQTDLMEYNNIFNIIWWRNLRLGNWHFFLNALEQRIESSLTYNVYMGTAGVLTMPYSSSCNKTDVLAIESDGVKIVGPQYIWTYLKSLHDNVTDDFVVIGYNSPFFVSAESDIFCEDICDQIDWLKNHIFGRVRLMASQGVVFCCRPHDVAEHISHFPINLKYEKIPQYNSYSTTEAQNYTE